MQDHLQRLLTRSAEIFAIMRRAANRLWDRTISTKQAIKANSPLGFWQINEEQPSIGVDPDDFDTHISGIRDAASASLGLWLSYIFFLFYLAVAVASITHRDLLVEGVLKLPILGIDLPMVAFFILGPILMIVSHAYTMIHWSEGRSVEPDAGAAENRPCHCRETALEVAGKHLRSASGRTERGSGGKARPAVAGHRRDNIGHRARPVATVLSAAIPPLP